MKQSINQYSLASIKGPHHNASVSVCLTKNKNEGRLQEREVHNDSYSSGKSILLLRYRQKTDYTKNSVGQAAVSMSWSCFQLVADWLLL